MNRISGNHASSLGLHPIVYFYSSSGRYQPTAFLGTVALLLDLETTKKFVEFTKVRDAFESFLLKYRHLINQITLRQGSGGKGYARIKQLLSFLIEEFSKERNEAEIIASLASHSDLKFLQPTDLLVKDAGRDFSADSKSEVFLRDALKDPLRCAICKGLIHLNAISIDHVKRREDGGLGEPSNGQLTHPFCNTTVKR